MVFGIFADYIINMLLWRKDNYFESKKYIQYIKYFLIKQNKYKKNEVYNCQSSNLSYSNSN